MEAGRRNSSGLIHAESRGVYVRKRFLPDIPTFQYGLMLEEQVGALLCLGNKDILDKCRKHQKNPAESRPRSHQVQHPFLPDSAGLQIKCVKDT